jgi:hypothetical protein
MGGRKKFRVNGRFSDRINVDYLTSAEVAFWLSEPSVFPTVFLQYFGLSGDSVEIWIVPGITMGTMG